MANAMNYKLVKRVIRSARLSILCHHNLRNLVQEEGILVDEQASKPYFVSCRFSIGATPTICAILSVHGDSMFKREIASLPLGVLMRTCARKTFQYLASLTPDFVDTFAAPCIASTRHAENYSPLH